MRYSSGILLLAVLAAGCAHNPVRPSPRFPPDANIFNGTVFEFKKGLWPEAWYLTIDNRGSRQKIEFTASDGETYRLVLHNGAVLPFDSPQFHGFFSKRLYVIRPGTRGEIVFKFPDRAIRNAREILFRGTAIIPINDSGHTRLREIRELSLTYDVKTKELQVLPGGVNIMLEGEMIRELMIPDGPDYRPLTSGQIKDALF